MTRHECRTCWHYDGFTDDEADTTGVPRGTGTCRKHPPVHINDKTSIGYWPAVDGVRGWCSEYEAAP